MRKTQKHESYSIKEKNQIVLLYLDQHMKMMDIIRRYDIGNKSQVYKWVKQYQTYGTVIDNRGKATKRDNPRKGRPRKYEVDLSALSKEALIEKVRLYEDIKKCLAYLKKD
ncbi:MAG: transposase [Acholeplasmataceae bacterium]